MKLPWWQYESSDIDSMRQNYCVLVKLGQNWFPGTILETIKTQSDAGPTRCIEVLASILDIEPHHIAGPVIYTDDGWYDVWIYKPVIGRALPRVESLVSRYGYPPASPSAGYPFAEG